MITCPVCEHPQADGVACDVCGHPFSQSAVAAAGHADPPPEPVPGLEPTALAPKAEKTAALAKDAPCVWCGHVQATGRICDRCGMQRHRGERVAASAPAGGAEETICSECGTPSSGGGRCRTCGARLPEAG